MAARVSTETAAAQEAILENLPALRMRLADQGFEVSQFQVEIADHGADAAMSGRNGHPQTGNREGGQPRPDHRPQLTEAMSRQTPEASEAATHVWVTAGGIDLHV